MRSVWFSRIRDQANRGRSRMTTEIEKEGEREDEEEKYQIVIRGVVEDLLLVLGLYQD